MTKYKVEFDMYNSEEEIVSFTLMVNEKQKELLDYLCSQDTIFCLNAEAVWSLKDLSQRERKNKNENDKRKRYFKYD